MKRKKSKFLECQKCGHVWNYTGDSEYFCTCPHCYTKVRVFKK